MNIDYFRFSEHEFDLLNSKLSFFTSLRISHLLIFIVSTEVVRFESKFCGSDPGARKNYHHHFLIDILVKISNSVTLLALQDNRPFLSQF